MATLLIPILVFVTTVLVIFLLKANRQIPNKNNFKKFPPSPPKLPIIGNLHQLGSLPHHSLYSLSQKYGPLMLLHLGQVPTLIVSSADAAEEIMKTQDLIFCNRPITTASFQLFYGGADIAFSPYSEYWRQLRKICVLELLSAKRVSSFRSVREEEMHLLNERILKASRSGGGDSNNVVKLSEMLLSFSSGIITRLAFGKKYGGDGGKNEFAELAVESMVWFGVFFARDFFPKLAWVDNLTGRLKRLKTTAQQIDAFLAQVIKDHRTREKKGDEDSMEQKDLVDVMLSLQKHETLGISLSEENLKGIILDIFVAGTDTTAITLEWAMAELIKKPQVMKKAQEEVRLAVGKDSNIKEDHLPKLNYLKFVIKETLRLHPVGPLLLPREASQGVIVHGYHIPQKTRVYINAYAIGRDPKIWENPTEFIPERFLNCPIDFKGQNFELIPFGAGRRICPGLSFANISLELALANLLYWFDWDVPNGQKKEDIDMTEAFGQTVHKKSPLLLVVKPHFV